MNKAELIDLIAKNAGLTKSVAGRALNVFLTAVSDSLSKGDSVSLVGFGSFVVSKRKAREGRNPQTGAVMKIPATQVPRFRPGKALKEAAKLS